MNKKYHVHLVSHTHWDREWYLSFQQFRMRLVKLMDELLDIFEKEKDYRHFNLDGQTICLEDYLEIRPEKKETVMKLIKEGKIAVGPWYVLPDGFLTGSEALIRNILIGDKIANAFGGKMQVGYLPDTFGHCSQIPQIMQKACFEGVVIWRGISGEPEKLKSEFIWQAPDGTEIFTMHLSDKYGYFNIPTLPEEPVKALEALRTVFDERKKFSVCEHVLLMNGLDHYPPQPHTSNVLKAVNMLEGEFEVIHSNITEYMNSVKASNPLLEKIKGEFISTNMSSGGAVNTVLRNVLSSRMYLKLTDFKSHRLLIRYAEPLMLQSFIENGRYDSMFLNKAWKYLVQNHPHDSICGCSIDMVHREMEMRYSWVQDITGQCSTEAMYEITGRIDTSAIKEGCAPIHLFNTLCSARKENAVEIVAVLEPGEHFRSIDVTDYRGNILNSQIIEIDDIYKTYNILEKYPENKMVTQIRLLVDIGEIGSFGYDTIAISPSQKPQLESVRISKEVNILENEFLRVTINANGTVNILEKETGKSLKELNYFLDDGDIGDEYVYSPPAIDSVISTFGTGTVISLEQNGPLIGVYSIKHEMDIPEETDAKGYGRSVKYIRNFIETKVILRKGSRIVEFETSLENNAKDHRIRVAFPTGIHTDKIYADSHFDIVERSLDVVQPPKNVWIESATGAGAQKRFIYINDDNRAMAVLNQGIPEYEAVQENGECTVYLTLLRCVGRIGSSNSQTISMAPGPEVRTQDSQCIGKYTMKYAIYMENTNWSEENISFRNINIEAEKYNSPLTFFAGERHKGSLPMKKSYLSIDNSNIMITALKKAENSDNIILRICNLSAVEENVGIKTVIRLSGAYMTNFIESRLKAVAINSNEVKLSLKSREIATLELER